MGSETSLYHWFAFPGCLVGQKGRMRFFLNIFRKKRIRPFWPMASLSTFCWFSCAFKAIRIYLLKSVPCYSALLSNPLRFLPSIYLWKIVIIYNSAGLWIVVPLSSIFQVAFLGAGCKSAGLLQALFWFRGQAEPVVNSSSWWEIQWPAPVPTPRTSLSLVPPLPLHPQDKLQPIRNRRLTVLILQGGRLLGKRLE